MNTEDKFKLIKELLAQGYKGSISEYIANIEKEEMQAMQAQAQAEQQGQNPNVATPALAGNIPASPQQSATERNIIQPGQYKKGGIKLNYGLGGYECKECGGSYKTGGKKKGIDGKACWEGYRYAGTENGKDKCVPINKYDEGGTKKTTEFVANAPIYDSQGQCWSNCGQRNFDPIHNVSVGAQMSVGKTSSDYTGAFKGTLGYDFNPSAGTGGITGYVGGNYGIRGTGNETEMKFKPEGSIVGSLGYKGEIGDTKSYRRRGNPLHWGAGAYVDKSITGDGTTIGGYGQFGNFNVSAGYNKNTGSEFKFGIGIPIREDGGVRNDSTYTHIPSDSLTKRQQFNESRFKSDAVSPDGATSVAQIMPDTFADGLKKGYVPKGTKYEDLAKDDELATQFQTAYMDDLLTRPWNKGSDKVKRAKALAAYNMGPTALVRFLNAQKKKDVDIYESLDWVEDLNSETKNYINNIMFGGDEKYEKEFKTLHDKKFKKIKKKRKGGIYDTGGASENIKDDVTIDLSWMQDYQPHTFAAESTSVPSPIPYVITEDVEEEQVETKKTEVKTEEVKPEDKNILNDTPLHMLPGLQEGTPFVIEADNTSVYVPPLIIEEADHGIKDLDVKKEQSEIQKTQVKNARKKETEKVRKSIQNTMDAFYQQYTKIDYDEDSSSTVKAMQQELVDAGYDLGKYGPNKDGIDGKFGNKTKLAYVDYMNKKLESKLPITFDPSTREEECDVNGCAVYVTTEFMNEGYDVDNMGVGGDAWTMYDQIVSQGNGSSVYNIFNNPEFKNVSSHHDSKRKSIEAVRNGEVTKNMFQIGDVVGLVYNSSNNWDSAYEATQDGTHFNGKKIKNKTYNSHVGFVSGIDENGNPVVSHNVNGKVYNDTWDNITGGGVGWIARPNSTKSGSYKYDYSANTTEHDNTELLNFFDEKNYEGEVDEQGNQKRYTEEEKAIQNNAINFVKNNVPIILDELEIPINGEDGQDWMTNAVIGIGMKETGLGTKKNAPSKVKRNRKVNNTAKTVIQTVDAVTPITDIEEYFAPGDEANFYEKSSLDPNDFSLGITKTKLSGIGEGSKHYYDINSTSIHTDDNKALAVTIDNFARNYRMLHTYAVQNPHLELTEEDIRNMTIISHQRGLLSQNKAGGGTGVNFGKRHDKTLEEQIESLRSMYEGSLYDVSSTNYRHLPLGQDYMYQREYGEHGAESYISAVNRYINRQVKTHEALALENKNKEETPPVQARLGGYTSKYGY